jgi:hypothetical protein
MTIHLPKITEEEEELRIKVWQNRLGQRKFLAWAFALMNLIFAFSTDDVPIWGNVLVFVLSSYCGIVIFWFKKEDYFFWKFVHRIIWNIIVLVFLILLLVWFVFMGHWQIIE